MTASSWEAHFRPVALRIRGSKGLRPVRVSDASPALSHLLVSPNAMRHTFTAAELIARLVCLRGRGLPPAVFARLLFQEPNGPPQGGLEPVGTWLMEAEHLNSLPRKKEGYLDRLRTMIEEARTPDSSTEHTPPEEDDR